MRAVLRPEPEHTPPGIAPWPSGSACLVPHGPARAQTISRPRDPHRRPRSFWCRSSFLVPGFEGPWHHSRKSSQLYSSRCMHTQTPPAYVLVQGRSRGSAGVGPGAVAWALWAVNCNAHAPMARPVRRHGRACPPRRAASRRELAALGPGGRNAAAMGRRRSGCNSFYHKDCQGAT
jgi:hypothetical protein